MSDKFSIAMCTYNGAPFVSAQLESFAAQTRMPDELVACDDGSDDQTVAILRRFAAGANFPVRIEINSQRLGVVKNFEKAIKLCNGDLVALSDQDDVWLPEKLARMEAEFAGSPALGLVFSDAELIDVAGNQKGRRLWDQLSVDHDERCRLVAGRGLQDLIRGATVTGATLAFRARYAALAAFPLPDNLAMIHDGWIALILSCVSRVAAIEQPLILYRQHRDQAVGARPRPAPVRGGLAAVAAGESGKALRRSNPYDATLVVARAAHDRLVQAGAELDSFTARAELGALITHLETRAELPPSFWRRLGPVLRELSTMRYFQFSNGFASALKDLVTDGRN
jgi:glycosyltransferase involved in cell wall biosynthesis